MANLNKVMLIGRLTRDPEVRTFGNGGKVAAFGFAVNNKRKNQQSGQWEDEPVFLDIEAFNRQSGRQLADLVEQFFKKGAQFYLEGHLRLDSWLDKNDGSKRSRLKIVLDEFQFFEPRADGNGGEGGMRAQRSAPTPGARKPEPSYPSGGGGFNEPEPGAPGDNPDDIPF